MSDGEAGPPIVARRRTVAASMGIAVVLALVSWWLPGEWHAALQGGVADRLGGWSGVELFRLGLGALAVYAVLVAMLWPSGHEALARDAARRAAPGRLSRRSALRWVASLTIGGALIRLVGLGGSFWLDELFTQSMATEKSWLENLTVFETTNNHIAHTLLTTMWTSLFGNHEWVVRLTAFFFGVAGIYVTYGLARRVASREAAVWASALCAVTYHHVMFSQNARGYTAQLFFFTLACGFLHDAVRSGRTRDWVRFVLCSWVSLWFVFLAGFTFVAHGLVVLAWLVPRALREVGSRARLRQAVLAFSGLALLSLQFYSLMVPSIVEVLARDYGGESGGGLHILSRNFLRDLAAGFGLTLSQAMIAGTAAAAFGVWVGLGVLRRYPLMAALLVSPGVVVVAFALQTGLDVYPRFFLPAMVAFFVVLAELGCRLGESMVRGRLAARHPLWIGWPLSVVLLLFVAMLPRVLGTPKQPYEGGLRWAWEHVRSAQASPGGPTVYCLGHAAKGCDFYAPRLGVPAGTVVRHPPAPVLEDARRAVRSDVVALTTLQRLSARGWPEVFEELRAHWDPIQRLRGTIGDGDVVLWQPRSVDSSASSQSAGQDEPGASG